MSTLPACMIEPMIPLPWPETMVTTPGGNAEGSINGSQSSTPNASVLKTTGLPMISAGMSVVKVSLSE